LFASHEKADLDPMTIVHRRVLSSCKRILPMTSAMAVCLTNDYGVPEAKISRVPSLFDVDYFDPTEIVEHSGLRLLFVGGDVSRKGGDLLYNAFRDRLSGKCSLTMVTHAYFPPCKGLNIMSGIRYGTPEHLEIMRNHDIFVLPTRQDAGPQVIGEAAAAGLAVFTTKEALGAPHVVLDGVTGSIADTPDQCIGILESMIPRRQEILEMRRRSLEHMRSEFSAKAIESAFVDGMQ
jgi:Glycosyl transferases group 1